MQAPATLAGILGNQINERPEAEDILFSLPTTPQMAGDLLLHREAKCLRSIKKHIVKKYGRQMATGGWRKRSVITVGVIPDEDIYFLIDGNHRLEALRSLANIEVTFSFRVIEFDDLDDVADFCCNCIDTGSNRTVTNHQEILGAFDNVDAPKDYKPKALAAIQFMMDGWKGKGGGSKSPAENPTLLAAHDDWHPYLLRYYAKVKDSKQLGSVLMNRGFLATGGIIFRSQPEEADRFYSSVIGQDASVSAFVDEVVQRGEFKERTPEGTARATAAAFNVFIKQGQIETLDDIITELGEGEWQKAAINLVGSSLTGEIERYHPTEVGDKIIGPNSDWATPIPDVVPILWEAVKETR